MGTVRFDVPHLSPCCAQNLQHQLSQQFPKANIHVCAINQCVEIEDNENLYHYLDYLHAIKKLGYSANWLPHWVKALIGLLLGGACLILCLFPLSFVAMLAIGVISSVLTIAIGFESFVKAFRALKSLHRLNMDSLFVVSTCLAMVISLVSLFIPGLPMMFELGLLVFGFRQLGLAIEASMLRKITTVNFQDLAPQVVQCFREDRWQRVDVVSVQVGERIKVNGVVPLDGTVLVDVRGKETHRTGQIQARCFTKDTLIFAGTEVETEAEIQVTQIHAQSYLMLMDKTLQSTMKTDSPLQGKITKALSIFVPLIFFLALLSGLLVYFLVGLLPGLSCAIAVLVCACPCVLGLVTPLMCKIGTGKAAKAGILLKQQEALVRAKDIDTVVFDLHGTLTAGHPAVTILYRYTTDRENDAVLMAAMERAALSKILAEGQSCSKAIAESILKAIGEVKEKEIEVTIEKGGLSACYQDKTYYLGDASLMKAKNIEVAENTTDLYFVEEGLIKAYIIWVDPLRPSAKSVVAQLRTQGKRVCICTGAPDNTAMEHAKQLGINREDCFSECFPQDKVDKIKALQAGGKQRVAMVGDGNNDVIVMEASDLSVALLSDFTGKVTESQAMVCIPHERFQSLPQLFAIAEETLKGVYIGLGVNVFYNVVSVMLAGGVLLAAGLLMPPFIGAVLMFAQVCGVLLGAYYLKQREVKLPPVASSVVLALSEPRPPAFAGVNSGSEYFNKLFPQDSQQNSELARYLKS